MLLGEQRVVAHEQPALAKDPLQFALVPMVGERERRHRMTVCGGFNECGHSKFLNLPSRCLIAIYSMCRPALLAAFPQVSASLCRKANSSSGLEDINSSAGIRAFTSGIF